ncbi:DUF2254 domain-containing protein [Arthrobacter sp. H20]|uniref:DUF2254 domain-containing protein n=1 Tax=Arthrobacter sp. H20 TaxID=1267981 RepID=UPI0004B2DC1E|nr:DUF2254 domain-containing protein [Arthrobacter sp. H20]
MWVIPVLFILGGVATSLITTSIDDGTLIPQSVSGDANAALQILYLISFAMLTLTGLVLSLVVVVVQLAMGVFSPRIVRQILQDRPSQSAIGLFAGTFAHSMLSMRSVQTTTDGGTVPGLAVVTAMVLVLSCIGTLVWYLNHIGQSLRVAALVGWVANDTMKTLNHVYPDPGPAPDLGSELVVAPKSGVMFAVDHRRLVVLAERAGCRLELLWAVGDYIPTGSALFRIVGNPGGLSESDVVKAVAIGPERTMNQDVAYGIRMLVDIAIRSLSSGPFEDPTTAVQAIDRIHDILRQICRRPLHSGHHDDDAGVLRLTMPTMLWEGYVRLGFDEVRLAGSGSPQVTRRLRLALDDLMAVAPAERLQPLEYQLESLDSSARDVASSTADAKAAVVPDVSGIGSADDLVTAPHEERG